MGREPPFIGMTVDQQDVHGLQIPLCRE